MTGSPLASHELLALARDAAGGAAWNAVRALRCRGTVSAGGLSGPYELLVDLEDGRSVAHYTLGPATMAKGFDGARAWQRGTSGEVVVQDSDAARAAALAEAFLNARGYWKAARWPASAQAHEARDENGVAHDAVTLTPAGGQPLALWFDRGTHRLARVVQEVLGRAMTRRFEDHRPAGPLLLPWRSFAGEGWHAIAVQFESVEMLAAVDEAEFAVPRATQGDFSIDGAPVVQVEIANNHVFLPASIGGCALRLLLDTGGVLLLTPEAAARAGLRAEGALEARGPGHEAADAGFARAPDLRIGQAATLATPLVRVIPMPGFTDVEGLDFDGVLGVELFERAVVRLDYAGRTLTLAAPEGYSPPAAATTLPLTFFAHFPCVEAAIDGHAGQFFVDTGNRNALTLWRPFVEANAPLQGLPASAETTIGWGVGGPVPGRVARGTRFTLGGREIEAPLLTLPTATEGATATRGIAGNIGGDLLRRFVVTLDYRRRQLHLEPGADVAQPFDHDRSGTWINRAGDAFVVQALMPGGPADEAGLRVGDAITAVDGTDARELALDAVRRRLRAHEPAHVRVTRPGATFEATLRLRDPMPD